MSVLNNRTITVERSNPSNLSDLLAENENKEIKSIEKRKEDSQNKYYTQNLKKYCCSKARFFLFIQAELFLQAHVFNAVNWFL